jgi:hypothetical protein
MTVARGERGAALLITIMAMLLLSAVATALILTATSETIVAAHFRGRIEARYAADAIIARALGDIAAAGDWTLLIDGSLRASWVDGPPFGVRALADGSTLDLAQAVNVANCQKSTACSAADLAAVTVDRPWGPNNPRWMPYSYGPLRNLLPAAIDSPYYVLLLVGNGPAAALLALRAEVFGPRGAHAVVEATAGRDYNDSPVQGSVKVLSWREVR